MSTAIATARFTARARAARASLVAPARVALGSRPGPRVTSEARQADAAVFAATVDLGGWGLIAEVEGHASARRARIHALAHLPLLNPAPVAPARVADIRLHGATVVL